MPSLRIFVADDHEVARCVIVALLTSHPGWEVCGEASDGREAIQKVQDLKPDIVLLDLAMPNKNGLEATLDILRHRPAQKIIILTTTESDQIVRNIFDSGARGFVVKAKATQDLNYAVEALQQGRTFFTARYADAILKGRLDNGGDSEAATAGSNQPQRENIQRLAKELAASYRSRGSAPGLARPLQKYSFAAVMLAFVAGIGWLTYTGQWDRVMPEVNKLSTRVGLRPAPTLVDEGNPETSVWVDGRTALYYCPGDEPYGKTPRGRYTKQRDAQLDHFEPAARKACE